MSTPHLRRQEAQAAPFSKRLSQVIDAAIAAAPECLRHGAILPSIDWRGVAPVKVASMLAALKDARVPIPRWLTQALLTSGHILPDPLAKELPGNLQILHRLNRADADRAEREIVGAMLQTTIADQDADPEIVSALVHGLNRRRWSKEAMQLALAHTHRVPAASRQVRSSFDVHVDGLPIARLRLAGFSTTQPFCDELRLSFAAQGWRAEISEADFGTALAELAQGGGDADCTVLPFDLEGFAPRDWRTPSEEGFKLLTERAGLLANALDAFSRRSSVPLLINTLPSSHAPSAGFLDRRHAAGLRSAIDLINGCLLDAAKQSHQIIVVDGDQALSDVPLSRQADPRLWFYGRIAYSGDATRALAHAFAQAWRQTKHGTVKAVAVDFDNTLWGGIYGDDGVERLQCGHEFPGNAFRAMQQECLRLKGQGILLVALSKNNADAITAFEQHPGMVLRSSDFAAAAVDWNPKPDNIRKISADLNIGLDSFLFLDDSPQERDAMRRLCPEVVVPELPTDPAERPQWLRRLACTWPVRLTLEDVGRATMYAVRSETVRLKARAATPEQFLCELAQRLTVEHASQQTLGRVAQMHERTNQFNLTTLRSSEAEIASLMADPAHGLVLLGSVADKFGEHGIVIAATASVDGEKAVLRSFLMSCRVIGREIERAFLGSVLGELKRRGVTAVYGDYLPTAKNGMTREFYRSCGFELVATDGEKAKWVFHIGCASLPGSQFVSVASREG